MSRLQIISIFVVAIVLFVADSSAQATGKNPVVIIPGVTGSQLVNPYTNRTVWFSVRRDKDDDIRLPITSPILSRNRDSLQVKDIIREIKFRVLPDIEVYQVLLDALKERGYTEADWKNPKATDVYYVFPYDWRRDNVESAHLLMRRLAAVKRSVRRPGLKFDIIAHSMGGLVARYAAMYGLSPLPPANRKPIPNWAGAAHINKLMMFGTPNEGSFNAFDAMLNGYPIIAGRKLPLVDDFKAEDVFSAPSSFQLLPHQTSVRFLDENLAELKIDLYDPKNWFKYGWGPMSDPKFLSKLRDAPKLALTNPEIKPVTSDKPLVGDDLLISRTTFAQARAYFVSALGRAHRFHRALNAVTKTAPVDFFAYGGNCSDTLDAVLLIRDEKKDQWTTLFDARDIKTASGVEIKKDQVKAAMFAKGDGRVTTRSLLAETALPDNAGPEIKTIFPLKEKFFACSSHNKLFLEKPIQDSFLSALVVERGTQP